MSRAVKQAANDASAVEASAVRLLAMREHCRQELKYKLARHGYAADLVNQVLTDLQQRDLLSDQRFAEAFVRQRVRKGYGPLRIRAELSERGVSAQMVDGCMQAVDVAWDVLLDNVAAKKYGGELEIDRKDIVKRGRQLQQRGFSISDVRRYLNSLRVVD